MRCMHAHRSHARLQLPLDPRQRQDHTDEIGLHRGGWPGVGLSVPQRRGLREQLLLPLLLPTGRRQLQPQLPVPRAQLVVVRLRPPRPLGRARLPRDARRQRLLQRGDGRRLLRARLLLVSCSRGHNTGGDIYIYIYIYIYICMRLGPKGHLCPSILDPGSEYI